MLPREPLVPRMVHEEECYGRSDIAIKIQKLKDITWGYHGIHSVHSQIIIIHFRGLQALFDGLFGLIVPQRFPWDLGGEEHIFSLQAGVFDAFSAFRFVTICLCRIDLSKD